MSYAVFHICRSCVHLGPRPNPNLLQYSEVAATPTERRVCVMQVMLKKGFEPLFPLEYLERKKNGHKSIKTFFVCMKCVSIIANKSPYS